MSFEIGTIEAYLKLKDEFSSGISKAAAKLEEFGSRAKQTMSAVGSELTAQRSSGAALIGMATSIVTAWGMAINSAREAEVANKILEHAIRSQAEGFNITSNSIKRYAQQLMEATGVSDTEILTAATTLLRFRKVGSDTFNEVLETAVNMASQLGGSVSENVRRLGMALNDPARGMRLLTTAGVALTAAEREHIKELVEHNKTLEAQQYLLAKVKEQFDGAAAAARDTMTGALRALKSEWDALIQDVGRETEAGFLRTAIESWIVWVRKFRDVMPQIGVAFYELIGSVAGSVASFVRTFALALSVMMENAAKFADVFQPFTGLGDKIRGMAASVRDSASNVAGTLDDLSEGMHMKAQEALQGWVRGSADVVAQGKKTSDELGEVEDKELEKAKKHYEQMAAAANPMIAALKGIDDAMAAVAAAEKGGYAEKEKSLAILTKAITNYEKLKAILQTPEFRTDVSALKPLQEGEFGLDLGPLDEAVGLTADLGSNWYDIGQTVRDVGEQYIPDALNATGQLLQRSAQLAEEWKKFKEHVTENFIRGVQSALSGFFEQLFEGSGNALANFGKALKQLLFKTLAEYLAQWAITQLKMLALSLRRIATEAAAQRAANAGSGGGGGGGGGGSLSNYMSMWQRFRGLFGGGGGAVAGSSAAAMPAYTGMAGAYGSSAGAGMNLVTGAPSGMGQAMAQAGGSTGSGFGGGGSSMGGAAMSVGIIVAAVALFKHLNDLKRQRSYSTQAEYGGTGAGSAYSTSGNAQSAKAMLDAIKGVYDALTDTLRIGSDGLQSVMIKMRGDKKAFRAYVDGELIGEFKTLEEATLAGVKKAVLNAADNLDEAVKQVLRNYQTTSAEEFIGAVQKVQALVDLANGLDDFGRSVMAVLPSIRQLASELTSFGLSVVEVTRLTGAAALNQFRQQWYQLSGHQATPAEQKKAAELNRKILLDQLKLYQLDLKAKLLALVTDAKIIQQRARLRVAEELSEDKLLRQEAKRMGIDLQMRQEYIDAQNQLNAEQAKIYNELIEETQQLIDEVAKGKINIGGIGGGRGRAGGSSWHDRMLSALEAIRDLQKRLVLGELSPYTGREKVSIAKAEVDRLMAQYAQGGQARVRAMEAIGNGQDFENYLTLFAQTFGTTGQYTSEFERLNSFLSMVLRQGGMAPVTRGPFGDNAGANADAQVAYRNLARIRTDHSGNLRVNDPESAEHGAATARETGRSANANERSVSVLENIEYLLRNNQSVRAPESPKAAVGG